MFLPQRFNVFSPQQFAGAGLLGTTQKFPLPRTWPIEDIYVRVNFTVSVALALTTNPTTPDQYDTILQLIQHINLSVNNGTQPRSVIDCSGVALLEYQEHDAQNIDIGTRMVMGQSQTGGLQPANYTLVYRLPMVDNSVGEPLRSRMYLPVHTYPQDPVLTLTFQNAATMYSTGTISGITVTVLVVGRQVTPGSEKTLQQSASTNPNGYFDWDLIETPFIVPLGSGAPIRLALPLPGSYSNLMMRHYLGGATMTRKEIDNGATGSSFGNENLWDIETAANAIRQWRWQDLRYLAEMSQVIVPVGINGLFGSTASGSYTGGTSLAAMPNMLLPMAGGSIANGTGFRYANSTWLDFLTDGQGEDVARELGSVLDCNTPANTGLKMEIVGSPTNVATNASQLNIMGRRIFGDLSKWQKFA